MNVVISFPTATLSGAQWWLSSNVLGFGTYGKVHPSVWKNEFGHVAKMWSSVTDLVHMQSFIREVQFAQTRKHCVKGHSIYLKPLRSLSREL